MSRSKPFITLSILPESQSPNQQRNVSNPYSLAIPQRTHRRSTYQRADTSTQYLEPPDQPSAKKGTLYLELPTATIVVTEYSRPYTLNGASRSTLDAPYVPEKKGEEQKKSKIDDRVLAATITLSLAILLAIVLPLAIIVPQRFIKPLHIKILMPLYLNPEQDSWKRLEDSYVPRHPPHLISPPPIRLFSTLHHPGLVC